MKIAHGFKSPLDFHP